MCKPFECKCIIIFIAVIRSPDVATEEPPLTSDSILVPSFQADVHEEETVEPSENDFDLEPAEPTEVIEPQIEPRDPIENIESVSQSDSIETNEPPIGPCDD